MMPAASFDLAAVQRRIRAAVEPVVQTQADTLAADARAKAPVRTGAYRDSLAVVTADAGPDVLARRIEAVKYARFIASAKIGSKALATRRRFVLTDDLGKPYREGKRARAAEVVAAARRGVNGRD